MRIRGPCLRNVGAPGNDETRVVPIGRFGHIGLLTPHLRAGRWQVAVPVVEARAHAADQAQVAAARGIRNHRHRRDWRKADDAIRAVFLDGMNVCGRDDLVDLIPAGAGKAAQSAHALVVAARYLVANDGRPGLDRWQRLSRPAPGLEQAAPHHGVLEAVRAIEVPAVARTARATAWLVVGHVPARARVVGLLCFPGDNAAFHVDLPRTTPGAVRTVG